MARLYKRQFLSEHLLIFCYLATLTSFPILFASQACAQKQRPVAPSNPTRGLPSLGASPGSDTRPGGVAYNPFDSMDVSTEAFPLMSSGSSRIFNAESCERWTAAGVNSVTVSIARLAIPGKASDQFQKACGSYKRKRFSQAEDQARNALKIYPDYAAAFVLLGQILTSEHKDDDARVACQQAMHVDPEYAPPYVCLADLAMHANEWQQAYTLSGHALSIDPGDDMYAYLYVATADFHLKRADEAEWFARSAEKLDTWHQAPEIHLLLAQIYEEKGDRTGEIDELHRYLKAASHTPESAAARATLAKAENQPAH